MGERRDNKNARNAVVHRNDDDSKLILIQSDSDELERQSDSFVQFCDDCDFLGNGIICVGADSISAPADIKK